MEKNLKIRKESNKAWLSGILAGEFEYSHELYGEIFYKNKVIAPRLSGVNDRIPIMVSSRIAGDLLKNTFEGKFVNLFGQFRSFNKFGEDGKIHLKLFLFVTDIEFCYEDDEIIKNEMRNSICLEGYICKPAIYRETPLGRQIADIVVAVNRRYRKSDYIPCVVWGRNAKFAERLDVGTKIQCKGRIQSREYNKIISEETNELEIREAYEVSVSQIKILE